jgi:hypothetical protein
VVDIEILKELVYKGTAKEITIKGIIISRFENGKVVEEWEQAYPPPPQGDKR